MSTHGLRAGTFAYGSCSPGLVPPGPHPLLIVQTFPNGNCLVAYVTHSDDLYSVGLELHRSDVPSAYIEAGGPLDDPEDSETSVLGLVNTEGIRTVVPADITGPRRLQMGSATIRLSCLKPLDDPEWLPLRSRIRTALGLPDD